MAKIVAHRIFRNPATTAANQKEFMKLWQTELPGVGSEYSVDRTMLYGIAIDTTISSDGNEQRVFQYMPVSKIASILTSNSSSNTDGVTDCFRLLFDCKDEYTKEELMPYLEKMVLLQPYHSTCDGLLQQHTDPSATKVTVDKDGSAVQLYCKKQ